MNSNPNNPVPNHHPDPDQLQAYLDQILEGKQILSLEEHLQTCPACRRELSRLENLVARLDTLPEISLQKDLSHSVLTRIKETRQVPRLLTWTMLIEGAAAGIVLGLVIPLLRSAGWIPNLSALRVTARGAIQVFLTQIASSWMVWWAGTQLSFSQFLKSLSGSLPPTGILPSPWFLILIGTGVGLTVNLLLLRPSFSRRNNGA